MLLDYEHCCSKENVINPDDWRDRGQIVRGGESLDWFKDCLTLSLVRSLSKRGIYFFDSSSDKLDERVYTSLDTVLLSSASRRPGEM